MTAPKHASTPIAIVGIGCKFPKADHADAFWANIAAGKVAFSEIPKDRWNHEIFFSANQRDHDKAWVASGSFIDSYREFAALHYGIAPRRLEVMDPQQRLLIEATRWALQDAGYEAQTFDRSRTGVFVGVSIAEYHTLMQGRILAMQMAGGDFGAAAGTAELRDALLDLTAAVAPMRAFTLAGSLTALASASISQTFDFGGPAYTIDSACASASVAINDAVLQLRTGLIDTAVAGGAYINLSPANLVAFTKIGAISPSGVCRPFDRRSDGFVQSDGVGLLFLKRLDDALAGGDRIHAVIRGTGCNNDGRGEGPMTPRVGGQLAVLRSAYADAGFSPASVAYFEAHGTATSVGDPAEVEALGTLLLEAGVTREAPALLGSVKGNIGHAMSAAGIAGLVKLIKVLEHRVAPPQPGFESPNPNLHLDRYPLEVTPAARPLAPREGAPLRGSVSSFGFGGTNSHLILEEPPRAARPARTSVAVTASLAEGDAPLPEAVLVTAPNRALLVRHLGALIAHLEGAGRSASLADLAYTLNARRRHERLRAVIGAKTGAELLANLRAAKSALEAASADASFPVTASPHAAIYDAGEPDAARPRIAFMYPGQGAQKVGLLRGVRARFPAFAEAFARYEAAVGSALPRPLSSYLYPWEDAAAPADEGTREAQLTATEVCQPAMAALGLASSSLLARFGVHADVSLGHSLGEFPALADGGVLEAGDAVRLVALRGSAMRGLELADTGAMAAVMSDVETVRAALAGMEGVWVANINHPRQVSISGTTPGVAAAVEALRDRGFDVQPLTVSHAFHSPLLAGVTPHLARILEAMQLESPKHPVASCIAAEAHPADPAVIRDTLVAHATSPVNFVRALEQAQAEGASVFVQVGAGSVLTSFARATLKGVVTLNLAPLEDDQGYELVRGLCTLAALGVEVRFEAVYEGEGRRVVSLPETPLEREAYWVVKDQPQPKPEITAPLPAEPNVRTVKLGGAPVPVAPTTASAPASSGLVELFAKQAEVLKAHAEIIAAQNRLLLGEAPLGAPSVEERIAAALREPAAALREPAAAPVVTAPTQTPAAPAAAANAPAAAPATGPDPEQVQGQVFEIVSRISAFPRETLRGEHRLVDELGFDSLMVADLGGALQTSFPSLGSLPPSLFTMNTTVADIAGHVASTLGKAKTEAPRSAAPPAPVSRYRVEAVARPRPQLGSHDVGGETWLVTEDGSALASEVSAALEARGAQVVRVRFFGEGVAAPARLSLGRLNLWPESWVEGLPKALAESNLTLDGLIHAAGLGVSDPAELVNPVKLLHPLAASLDPARLITLTALGGRLGLEKSPALVKNLLQATLTGYTKALARERPARIVRTFDLSPSGVPSENAAWIVDELRSADRTVEVGFDGKRQVAELRPVNSPGTTARRLGPDDVVLITGGAGEIGALAAKQMAAKGPKAVLLVGRRPVNAEIEALLARLRRPGTEALYVAADVSNARALRAALEPIEKGLGPVTVVFHAAGLIEDAPVGKKTLESVERVMDVKVRGVQAILQALPTLSDLVLFSSWAGRFGNAGQADYAAANEVLDRLAVAGLGAARVISVAWPPWSSTAMVRSIPEGIRKMMAAQGVTFLEDAEGAAILDALFAEGARGLEVVGRGLPQRAFAAEQRERFLVAKHPYLEDHRLKGRPVVPLASITDWLAHTFTEAASGSGALVLEDLELVRGVMGDDLARVSLTGHLDQAGRDAGAIEVRAATEGSAEQLAYRAQARTEKPGPLSVPSLGEATEAASIDLPTFYARHTFHGAMLRGIERVEQITARGVRGVVRGVHIGEWLPGTARTAWTLDPLVVDSAFQLAAYWLVLHGHRVGFPIGFSKLTLLRPVSGGSYTATVILGELSADTFLGDVYLTDANGQLAAVLEGVRGRFAEVRAEDAPAPGAEKANGNGHHAAPALDAPRETFEIAAFPEVEELDQRFQMAQLIGLENPYFHMHAGTAKDTSVVDGVEMLNYSSYNYLGFSGHPEVVAAAQEAIARYGTSVSASRIASGERPLHRELEQGIAEHVGVDDSIVFVSGHATNVTTVGHLFDRQDLIVHDALIHDSILQGIYLSGATRRPFPHQDLDALERTLAQVRRNYRRVLVVAEGIYSMDGDICDLPRLIELKKRYQTLLMVDEAHSIGVLGHAGRGVAHHFSGLDPRDVDIWMGTLSKSFASCGGYIAGSSALVRYLKYTAPGFVYSAGITPPNAAAALKSLELMHRQPEVVEQLRQRSRYFLEAANSRGINTGLAAGAAVVPAIVGNSLECMRLSQALKSRRINVQPIVYPAVEDDAARLRFFISALHSEEQLRHTAEAVVEELAKIRQETQAGAALSI